MSVSAGSQAGKVTVSPAGGTDKVERPFALVVPAASLRFTVTGEVFHPGDIVPCSLENVGGVPWSGDYLVTVEDARGVRVAELHGFLSELFTQPEAISVLLPSESLLSGRYHVRAEIPPARFVESIEITGGVAPGDIVLQADTDKASYLIGETATGESGINNNSSQRISGELGLRVVSSVAASGRWEAFTEKSTVAGLPSQSVNEVLSDSSGNVWACTQRGLGRFLGVKWEVVREEGAPFWINVLTAEEAPDGAIWFGTEGEGVYRRRVAVSRPFRPMSIFSPRGQFCAIIKHKGKRLCRGNAFAGDER
jgi:hypothetical protein